MVLACATIPLVAEERDDSKKLSTAEILRRVALLPPEERKRAERALVLQYQPSIIVNRTPEAEELERQGWEVWLTEMAPHVFRGTHASFHRDFWNWYWPLLIAKRDGVYLRNTKDDPLAYLLTLGRSMGKSTTTEWATITMGALLGQVLVLYISSTSGLASGHLTNIREELEDSLITKYYPGLSNPEVGKHDNRYGWNKDLLSTQSGLTIFAVGLEEEIRGVKKRQMRPSLIVLDEFDSKSDSPDVVKKKEGIIGGSIFGTGVKDTIVLAAQNLIHANSVATRTFKRRNQLLSHRRESGLIKAYTNDLEVGMVGTRWKVTKGKPTWPHLDEEAFQAFLDKSGPIEVFAEYQHEFNLDNEGKVLKNYDDKIMVITEEDFARIYKVDRVPASWNKYMFNDVARTKSEYHANVGGTLTMSSQNTPLSGITFLYDCLSFDAETEPDDCAIAFLKCISPTVWAEGQHYEWEDLQRVIISRNNIGQFTSNMTDRIKAEREGLARIFPKYVTPLLTSQHYQKLRMSHERDDWRRIYRQTYGLPFSPSMPTEGEGIALINFTMKVDHSIPDPFKRTYTNDDGYRVPLMGMSRFYIIVKKDKLPYPDDNKPNLLHGSDLARYQFTEHRYLQPKQNALGEMERGQEKRNDDFCNGLQFLFSDCSIRARELTPQEMAEETMRPEIQLASIAAETDPETRVKMMMSREIALKMEYQAKIVQQLGGGTGRRSGNALADFRRFERLRRG